MYSKWKQPNSTGYLDMIPFIGPPGKGKKKKKSMDGKQISGGAQTGEKDQYPPKSTGGIWGQKQWNCNICCFPGGTVVKNLPASARNARGKFDLCVRKIPWRRNGNPLQYSCLENFMDRRAWQATVHGVAKELDTTEHAHVQCMLL